MVGRSYIVTRFPWFEMFHSFRHFLYAVFSGPYTDMSSGYNLWLQWDGKVTIWMPFSVANSIILKLKWESWLCNINSIGFSLLASVKRLIWLTTSRNISDVIQPFCVANPTVPSGAPCTLCNIQEDHYKRNSILSSNLKYLTILSVFVLIALHYFK